MMLGHLAAAIPGERSLGDAVKDGLLRDNPVRGAIARPRRRPELHFWISIELAAFLSWLDGTGTPHDKALYRLAAQTGFRSEELLGHALVGHRLGARAADHRASTPKEGLLHLCGSQDARQ
ncbi:MAG TPA: hypothetical protein VKF14_20950 [Candidatus Dormibacteraeota bacterium]|nr:hypothetical protein [Candidatus Dormibacteraeota bacterium]